MADGGKRHEGTLLGVGFYYKTVMWPAKFWESFMQRHERMRALRSSSDQMMPVLPHVTPDADTLVQAAFENAG
ncbi:hypothetical protein [Mesorhizobium sp. WSM2239]|uniref:Uncharacterized protein n=2 Tax=unclassified Mesorhizobium TaxID=325217 RepID=A0AAU8DHM9_9HYPH